MMLALFLPAPGVARWPSTDTETAVSSQLSAFSLLMREIDLDISHAVQTNKES